MRIARISCLALLLLVAACVAPFQSQPIATPASVSPSSAANRAPDALYIRQAGNGSPGSARITFPERASVGAAQGPAGSFIGALFFPPSR